MQKLLEMISFSKAAKNAIDLFFFDIWINDYVIKMKSVLTTNKRQSLNVSENLIENFKKVLENLIQN